MLPDPLVPNSRIEGSPSGTEEAGVTLSASIYRCLARFSVWHSTPSDTERHPPTPAGMPRLRHKVRHKSSGPRMAGPRGPD